MKSCSPTETAARSSPAPRRLLPLRFRRQPITTCNPFHPVGRQFQLPAPVNRRLTLTRIRVITRASSPPARTAHCTTSPRHTSPPSAPDGSPPCRTGIGKAIAVVRSPTDTRWSIECNSPGSCPCKTRSRSPCAPAFRGTSPRLGSIELPIIKLPAGMSTMPEGTVVDAAHPIEHGHAHLNLSVRVHCHPLQSRPSCSSMAPRRGRPFHRRHAPGARLLHTNTPFPLKEVMTGCPRAATVAPAPKRTGQG